MSETAKKLYKNIEIFPNKAFNIKSVKKIILDYFLRNFYFDNCEDKKNNSKSFILEKIASKFLLPKQIIEPIIRNFLLDIRYFNIFINSCKIRHNPLSLERQIKVYLYKVHRIAPVFDYKRALVNLKSLLILCKKYNFWPQISTQLACIIYITDVKDLIEKKIIQKNIRRITGCSAYAFHKVRNVLGIDVLLKKKIKKI